MICRYYLLYILPVVLSIHFLGVELAKNLGICFLFPKFVAFSLVFGRFQPFPSNLASMKYAEIHCLFHQKFEPNDLIGNLRVLGGRSYLVSSWELPIYKPWKCHLEKGTTSVRGFANCDDPPSTPLNGNIRRGLVVFGGAGRLDTPD